MVKEFKELELYILERHNLRCEIFRNKIIDKYNPKVTIEFYFDNFTISIKGEEFTKEGILVQIDKAIIQGISKGGLSINRKKEIQEDIDLVKEEINNLNDYIERKEKELSYGGRLYITNSNIDLRYK